MRPRYSKATIVAWLLRVLSVLLLFLLLLPEVSLSLPPRRQTVTHSSRDRAEGSVEIGQNPNDMTDTSYPRASFLELAWPEVRAQE